MLKPLDPIENPLEVRESDRPDYLNIFIRQKVRALSKVILEIFIII